MDINPDKRALLQRAISDPASITPAEKNDILSLPPPDEENQLHQSVFNLASRAALVAKALPNDGADLTYAEARWLGALGLHNPFVKRDPQSSLERLERRFRTPVADRQLIGDAQAAVLTSDEKMAHNHGIHQTSRLGRARSQAQSEARAEQLRQRQALRRQPRPKWIQEMKDVELPRWGFVILRTAYSGDASDSAWRRFQDYFSQTGNYVMTMWNGGLEMWQTHKSVFISDRDTLDDADTAVLQARLRAMRDTGQIPDGVRDDVFLVVDRDVLSNKQMVTGTPYSKVREPRETVYLRAVDPDHDPSAQLVPTEGPYAGYNGEVTVPLPRVYDWLYYTFFAGSESWQVRYREVKTREWKPDMMLMPFWPYPRYG